MTKGARSRDLAPFRVPRVVCDHGSFGSRPPRVAPAARDCGPRGLPGRVAANAAGGPRSAGVRRTENKAATRRLRPRWFSSRPPAGKGGMRKGTYWKSEVSRSQVVTWIPTGDRSPKARSRSCRQPTCNAPPYWDHRPTAQQDTGVLRTTEVRNFQKTLDVGGPQDSTPTICIFLPFIVWRRLATAFCRRVARPARER